MAAWAVADKYTITFLRLNDLDITAQYAVYHTTTRGASKTIYGGWKSLWPVPEEKAGFGFGEFGHGNFGFGGMFWRQESAEQDLGFGYGEFGYGYFGLTSEVYHYRKPDRYKNQGFGFGRFGYGHVGYCEHEVTVPTKNLDDGLHVFDVRLKDGAGNIGTAITDDIAVWICDTPEPVSSLALGTISGSETTWSWTASPDV